jgi:hypothetical protein
MDGASGGNDRVTSTLGSIDANHDTEVDDLFVGSVPLSGAGLVIQEILQFRQGQCDR